MDRSSPRRGRRVLALCLSFAAPALLTLCAASAGTAAAAPSPTPVWVATAAGPGGTAAAGRVVVRDRASGALYVAGTASVSARGSEIMVVKYNAAGVQQWIRTYRHDGAGSQTAVDGALDKAGDFVVLGAVSARQSRADWAVLKYAPDGTRRWATTIAGAGHGNDVPGRLVLSSSGAAYAAGGLSVAHHGLKATVVKLTSAGKVAWKRSVAGPGGPGQFSALGLDGAGRVFCAGTMTGAAARGADCLIAAYSSEGRRLWSVTWGGAAQMQDGVSDLVVSRAGAVSAVGWFGTKSGTRAMIRRYDSGGRFLWQATYSRQGGGSAQFVAAALLPRGRVVATGTLVNVKTGNSNIVTVGFAAKGPSLWQRVWDTPHPPSGVSHDLAADVVVDAAGRVFVCGSLDGASSDFAVLAYTAAGVPIMSATSTWDGGHGDDFARALTTAPGGVVVTGRSQVHRGRFQMATVELPY